MKIALHDALSCFKSLSVAWHFAWGDTKARYRRSILGPLWIVFGTAIGVGGLGFLWSALLKVDSKTLVPSLTIGLVMWQLINGCITESPYVFVRNAHVIRNIKISFLTLTLQMLMRQIINFAHNFLVIIAVLFIFPPHVSLIQLMVLPGLLLVLGNLLWVALILGMLGARFRDLEQLISAVMPMMFFLSPVIFRPDHLPINTAILWLNPFTYLITIIRDPLMGVLPAMFVYEVPIISLIIGWALALWFLAYRHGRIAFWV